jgi:hypothetical protein
MTPRYRNCWVNVTMPNASSIWRGRCCWVLVGVLSGKEPEGSEANPLKRSPAYPSCPAMAV